jgi:hypothetical protein
MIIHSRHHEHLTLELEETDLDSADLNKQGAWSWSLGWAPESYCAEVKQDQCIGILT